MDQPNSGNSDISNDIFFFKKKRNINCFLYDDEVRKINLFEIL